MNHQAHNTHANAVHQQRDSHEQHNPHQQHHSSHGHAGHDHHAMIEDFRKRLIISLVLTLPILVLSQMIQMWLGIEFHFSGDIYVLFGLATFVFFYGGWPFLTGMTAEIQEKSPGMMTLIAMAITVAYLFSSAVVFGFPGQDFFWELATLIDIMLFGHLLEMKSVLGASKALELLVSMMPSEAHRITGENIEDVKLEDLQPDDIILVKPGEKIPADGIVVAGESYVNESMLTGESKPVKKAQDEKVIGGSVNGNGSVKVRVEHTGKNSYLNKVITLVQEAQKTKSRTQHLADRAAKWLTYSALSVGFITLAVWLATGYGLNFALERMVTVLVISCPHALGVAVPLVVAISTALSAQNGLLIRNRTAFEDSRKITTIVFDKTGTLTKGEFGVTRIEPIETVQPEYLLSLAAALEQNSEHPIAVGILQKAKESHVEIPVAESFHAIVGKGVEATVQGKNVKVVSPGYLRDNAIALPENTYVNEAETVVFVLVDDKLHGFFALADEIRPESGTAITAFRENNIKVMMATGDNEKVARAVAEQLGLDGYYAEVLPHQKVDIIKKLQQQGEYVAMTGDGINDAPALAQADVGIAVGSGTDVAAETADIILVNSNPMDILNLILFGQATYKKMIQNLLWATGYNVVAIPLAAGALFSFGILLSPAIGAILMSLSTIIVAINAQLLKSQIRLYHS